MAIDFNATLTFNITKDARPSCGFESSATMGSRMHAHMTDDVPLRENYLLIAAKAMSQHMDNETRAKMAALMAQAFQRAPEVMSDILTAGLLVMSNFKTSSSFLQRRMKVGKTKADYLLQELHSRGVIELDEDNWRASKVLVTNAEDVRILLDPSIDQSEFSWQSYASDGQPMYMRESRSFGIKLIHGPTLQTVTVSDFKSQHHNSSVAMIKMQKKLAKLK